MRLLPTAVLALLATACHEATAFHEIGDPSAPEPEGVNSAAVLLDVDPALESIELIYEFEHAISEFSFRYRADPIRNARWSPLDQTFVLENYSVRRDDGESFERVRVGVNTDAEWYDRIFPAFQPVGNAGLVFNTDFLMLEEVQIESIRARIPPGNVIAYANFVSSADTVPDSVIDLPVDAWHFVFFGPEELVQKKCHWRPPERERFPFVAARGRNPASDRCADPRIRRISDAPDFGSGQAGTASAAACGMGRRTGLAGGLAGAGLAGD